MGRPPQGSDPPNGFMCLNAIGAVYRRPLSSTKVIFVLHVSGGPGSGAATTIANR